jgi:hypothetical protein
MELSRMAITTKTESTTTFLVNISNSSLFKMWVQKRGLFGLADRATHLLAISIPPFCTY